MRIITGTAKGRRLQTLEGLHTRPTTERVKEAVFSVIQFGIADARVLDLFAGSGQMGLEALSRGARHCVLCDNDRNAQAVLRKNIAACRMEDRAELFAGDFQSCIARAGRGMFDLIFLDPPYGGDILNTALSDIFGFDILRSSGIIVCESGKGDVLREIPAPYRTLREYRYGNSVITTLTRENA